jgi:serine/threonine protein phosphatase PrpC
MLNLVYIKSSDGDRNENLDRYGHIKGSGWSLSYLFDGFKIFEPHYVDRLQLEIEKISLEQGNLKIDDILKKLAQLISIEDSPNGNASVVFVISTDEGISVLYAGDTRAYFLSSKKRTLDHSRAQQMIDEGRSKSDTLPYHPLRRYLTKHLNGTSDLNSLVRVNNLEKQEIILCTDGVWACINSDHDFFNLAEEGGSNIYEQAISNCPSNQDNMTILHLKP